MHTGRITTLLFCCLTAAFSQQAPTFDVASVKVTPPPPAPTAGRRAFAFNDRIVPSPGGITMSNIRLKAAIQWAYDLQTIQVVGPGWMDDERYDILAKSSGPVETAQLRLMTQALLAERFKLAVHREHKEMPAYVITVAKGGHKLTPSECGSDTRPQPNGNQPGSFSHVSFEQLTKLVSSPLPGVVVDQTGLKGCFDFHLDMSTLMPGQAANLDDAIGTIMQAIGEQLGLKIDTKKVPADVLIVDHAEKVPVGN